MKQLLFFTLFFLACLFAPFSIWAQTSSCQPADCCQVCCSAKTDAAATKTATTAPAAVRSAEASKLINFWIPATGCDKKTTNEASRPVKDDNSLPSSSGPQGKKTKAAVCKPEKC